MKIDFSNGIPYVRVKISRWGTETSGKRRNYQMIWYCPIEQKRKTKSTGTTAKRDAERQRVAHEHWLNDVYYRFRSPWRECRRRFEREKCRFLAANTQASYSNAIDRFETAISPATSADITASAISTWVAELRNEGLADQTLEALTRAIFVFANWLYRMQMLHPQPAWKPFVAGPKPIYTPLLSEDIGRMIAACDAKRPLDAVDWKRAILAIFHGGLRISEAHGLHWGRGALGIQVDSECVSITRRFSNGARPGNKLLPWSAPPLLAAGILHATERDRFFIPFLNTVTGQRMHQGFVSHTIAEIGRASGINATTDDLRKSGYFHWAIRSLEEHYAYDGGSFTRISAYRTQVARDSVLKRRLQRSSQALQECNGLWRHVVTTSPPDSTGLNRIGQRL